MRWKCLTGMAGLLTALALMCSVALAQPNLVPNGDVETDSEPDGTPDTWFHSDGVSYPDDNGPSGPGSKSIQLDAADKDWRSSSFELILGAKYVWSLDYKFLEGATGEFRADLRFFDGPEFRGEDAPLVAVSNIGEWQTLGPRMVTGPSVFNPDNPLGDNVADIRLSSDLFAPGNGLVRFDNITVQLIPEPSTLALSILAGGLALAAALRRRSVGAMD